MKLGNKVRCCSYSKKRRLTGVFYDKEHKEKFEIDRGFTVDNFVFLTEQDDCEYSQELFDKFDCEFDGIVIGKIEKPTFVFYYDFEEEARLRADSIGYTYRKCLNDPIVGVSKEEKKLFYKVAFRMNQVRLVDTDDIKLLE